MHDRLSRTFSLMVCLTALALVASALTSAGRTGVPPQPTRPDVIAALEELDAAFWTDSAGRVWKVDLSRRPIGDDDLAVLAELPDLQWLSLRGVNAVGGGLGNEGIRHLSGLKHLQFLNLSANQQLRDATLAHLRGLRNLESLCLCGTRVTNDGLVYLKSMPRLTRLSLPAPTASCVLRHATPESGGVTQEGLVHLHGSSIEYLGGIYLYEDGYPLASGLTKLRRLSGNWTAPRDTDLVYLRNFTQLEAVRVTLSEGWTDTSRLQQLRTMKGLTTLEITGREAPPSAADWSGLAVLAELPRLQRLRLSGITDGGLAHLPRLSQLETLDLSLSPVDGTGLGQLEGLPGLKALTLNQWAITNSGLENLRLLPQLRELRLDGNPFDDGGFADVTGARQTNGSMSIRITDQGLEPLEHLRQLRRLELNDLPVTDAGLSHLRELSELEELQIMDTRVTDAGLVYLRGLSNLHNLEIYGTAIGIQAAGDLHDALPRCRISDNWCCGCMEFLPER